MNELLTSRLHQFENTAVVEVPALLAGHPVAPHEQLGVAAWVQGLQDWQAGGHEWHARSSRYMNEDVARAPVLPRGPTGLGTADLRLPGVGALGLRRRRQQHTQVPHRPVGHLELPDLYMPYAVRTSPHLDGVREYAVGWAREMGMLDAVWDERRFRGFDLAHCAAMIHADAEVAELELSADWLAWGTYGDDWFPVVFGARRDVVGAGADEERLALFMPVDPDTPTPLPQDPVERGLADLWQRTAAPMPPDARAQFHTAVRDMTASWVWELANQAQHRIPDPVDYVEMRRRTFGSDMTMSLARLAHLEVVPPEVYRSGVWRELDTAAQDYACFLNDLFSYQKEVEFEGEVHNMVLVVETFLDVDRLAARDVVARLMEARMQQFEQLLAEDLPALLDQFELAEEVRAVLVRHAEDLREWMSGILEWHRTCVRYGEDALRADRTPAAVLVPRARWGPSGVGTAAARLGA